MKHSLIGGAFFVWTSKIIWDQTGEEEFYLNQIKFSRNCIILVYNYL